MRFLAALLPALGKLTKGIIAQLLVALGITAVTYNGIEPIFANFRHQITANLTGAPQDALQLFYIAGGGTALNIMLGGLTFYVTMTGVSKITSRIGKK
ncbi:DUF2523 domain-containing protein [Neisseriaceae bacterium B1]